MNKRPAFTLVELLVAIFIFSYIAASMATIYSTTSRHMFQNYRRNTVKSDVLIAMRAVQMGLTAATRLDAPARNTQGNVLAFAENVDQNTGCFPISNAVPQLTWHYFCLAGDNNLYHHSGQVTGNGIPCGTPGGSTWGAAYPVPGCGMNIGGQTVTLLMRNVSPANGFLFSRRAADGIDEAGSVRIRLRSFWSAAGRGFGSSQRDIDFSLDTVVTANIPN